MLVPISIPLVESAAADAAGGLLAFGFRVSLLLRFCPLAMIGFLCARSIGAVGENERPRDLQEVRGQKA